MACSNLRSTGCSKVVIRDSAHDVIDTKFDHSIREYFGKPRTATATGGRE